jgi:hypothetical protein
VLDRVDVLSLFGTQFGLATTGQLTELGIARSTIHRARERAAIVPVLPGVYTLAGRPLTFGSSAMAAQLYYGADSYLTGSTAAVIHGFRGMIRSYVHVATRRRSRLRTPKWVKHLWTPGVEDSDVVQRSDGFRVASGRLTLLVLASRFNDVRFAQAAEDAWHRKLITPDSFAEYVDCNRGSGHPGVRRIDAWLRRNGGRERASQSGFEFDVIQALLGAGLPEPERQHPLVLPSGELIHLDIAWPMVLFGVEPGHSWFHRGDLKSRKDEARDRACGEIGWLITRYDEVARADLRGAAAQVARTFATRHRQLLRRSSVQRPIV